MPLITTATPSRSLSNLRRLTRFLGEALRGEDFGGETFTSTFGLFLSGDLLLDATGEVGRLATGDINSSNVAGFSLQIGEKDHQRPKV